MEFGAVSDDDAVEVAWITGIVGSMSVGSEISEDLRRGPS